MLRQWKFNIFYNLAHISVIMAVCVRFLPLLVIVYVLQKSLIYFKSNFLRIFTQFTIYFIIFCKCTTNPVQNLYFWMSLTLFYLLNSRKQKIQRTRQYGGDSQIMNECRTVFLYTIENRNSWFLLRNSEDSNRLKWQPWWEEMWPKVCNERCVLRIWGMCIEIWIFWMKHVTNVSSWQWVQNLDDLVCF